MKTRTLRVAIKKYVVAFMLLVYEKPRTAARLTSAKIKNIGYVMIPKVPTMILPTGRTFCKQAKMNAREKIIRQIVPNTFLLVELKLTVDGAKINSYSIDASKSS